MTDRLVVTPFSGYDQPALIPQPSALLQGFSLSMAFALPRYCGSLADYSTRILRPRLLGSALRYIRRFNSNPL